MSQIAHQAGVYKGLFCKKRLRVFLLSLEWHSSPKNTIQCPRPGLESRPLDPETNAVTMTPSHLPKFLSQNLNDTQKMLCELL